MSSQPPEKGLTMSQPESSPSVSATFTHRCRECGSTVHFVDGQTQPHECPNVPGVDPARVARYAEAIFKSQDGWPMAWADLHEDVQAGYVAEAKVAIGLADAELAELQAEVEQLRRGGRELGRMVVRHGEMVLHATGLHDWIDEDGDGDWAAVWENLAELRPRAKKAEAMVIRLTDAAEGYRGLYEAAAAKVAAVEALAAEWAQVELISGPVNASELILSTKSHTLHRAADQVRAALAAALPGAGGLGERDDPRQRADDEAGEVMEWLDREGGE